MPQTKKDPSVRRRVNKASTATTVSTPAGVSRVVPALPEHPTAVWHPQTVAWWDELWSSSLPDAWQDFDKGSLFTLALSFNDIWIAPSPAGRKEALGEYRLQRRDFFIAPYNRLQGEIVIEQADEAKDRGASRRSRVAATAAKPAAKVDPRQKLRAVQ